MPSNLVVLVVMYTFDDIDFARLRMLAYNSKHQEEKDRTDGHIPLPSVQNAGQTPGQMR